jgi:radical SAM superfamily enzyme YgiQ (UPF0313 family)
MNYPSLTLKQLAAITPSQHEVELVDERCQEIPFDKPYDVVGISSLTYNAVRAYEVADEFQKRGIPVVLGGYHPTILPKEAKQHADAVVIGEAELSWSQLLADLEQGKLKPFYTLTKLIDPKQIPPACHDLGIQNPFLEAIQATRGCPNKCHFCSIAKVEGNIFRKRPIDNIIKEIAAIRQKRLFFADASLTINPVYSKSLFQAMKPLNKTFDCCGNINILAQDDEFLKLASDAGCRLIQVGFESISQDVINAIAKKTNKVDMYKKAVQKVQDHGIMVMGLFMFGFDTEKPDVFKNTLEATYDWQLERARFSILTPFPGTQLCDQLEQEQRILSKDWSKYDMQTVVFQPKQMTIEELAQGAQKSLDEFYSLSNTLKRSFQHGFSVNRFLTMMIKDFTAKRYYKMFGSV